VDSLFVIVEGHGEVRAAPGLLHRLLKDLAPGRFIHLFEPYRLPRTRLVNADDPSLARALALARSKITNFRSGRGAVLVMLDADGDCPATKAQEIVSRATHTAPDLPLSVVLAKQEFEAWLLAGAQSLRTSPRVRPDASPPADPEAILGAKEFLERNILRPGLSYRETTDQPALTRILSLAEAESCRSFRKLKAELAGIAGIETRAPIA
jgi:hypothetical protein